MPGALRPAVRSVPPAASLADATQCVGVGVRCGFGLSLLAIRYRLGSFCYYLPPDLYRTIWPVARQYRPILPNISPVHRLRRCHRQFPSQPCSTAARRPGSFALRSIRLALVCVEWLGGGASSCDGTRTELQLPSPAAAGSLIRHTHRGGTAPLRPVLPIYRPSIGQAGGSMG